jgi:hypothetical protein
VSGGTYSDGTILTVTLSCATPGSEIYYTTDGTAPVYRETGEVLSGTLYTEPIIITKSTELLYVAFAGGMNPSDIWYEEYIIGEDNRYARGDCNGDGDINASDLTYLKLYFVGRDGYYKNAAMDCNRDNRIDIADMSYMKRYLVRKPGFVLGDTV